MKFTLLIVLLFLSFPRLRGQVYSEYKAKANNTSNVQKKLQFLLSAGIRSNTYVELLDVLHPISKIIAENHLPKFLIKFSFLNKLIGKDLDRFFSLKTYKKLLKSNASPFIITQFLEIIGIKYALEAKTKKASTIALMLLKINPKNAKAHLILGQPNYIVGDENSLVSLQTALKFDSTLAVAYLSLAVKLAWHSNWIVESESSTESIILLHPSHSRDLDSLYSQKKIGQALSYINKALKYDPLNSYYLKIKGDLLLAQLKDNKALDFYLQAIKIDSNLLAIRRIISIYKENNQYDLAINFYTKYISSNSNYLNNEFKIGRAYLYYLKQEYNTSLKEILSVKADACLNCDHYERTIQFLIGANYCRIGSYVKSLKYLSSLDSPYYWGAFNHEFYYTLALAYYKSKQAPTSQIIKLIDIALFYYPNNKEYIKLKKEVEQTTKE